MWGWVFVAVSDKHAWHFIILPSLSLSPTTTSSLFLFSSFSFLSFSLCTSNFNSPSSSQPPLSSSSHFPSSSSSFSSHFPHPTKTLRFSPRFSSSDWICCCCCYSFTSILDSDSLSSRLLLLLLLLFVSRVFYFIQCAQFPIKTKSIASFSRYLEYSSCMRIFCSNFDLI